MKTLLLKENPCVTKENAVKISGFSPSLCFFMRVFTFVPTFVQLAVRGAAAAFSRPSGARVRSFVNSVAQDNEINWLTSSLRSSQRYRGWEVKLVVTLLADVQDIFGWYYFLSYFFSSSYIRPEGANVRRRNNCARDQGCAGLHTFTQGCIMHMRVWTQLLLAKEWTRCCCCFQNEIKKLSEGVCRGNTV